MELFSEKLRNFDGDQDAAKHEDHGVSDRRNHDGRIPGHREWLDKVVDAEWSRVNTTERQILLLEVGAMMFDAAANIAGLGAKEEIENELDSIYLA